MLGGLFGGGQPSPPAAVPAAVPDDRDATPEPQARPRGLATGGEVIDVDLPESRPVERKNDDGGSGGILGDPFGKK